MLDVKKNRLDYGKLLMPPKGMRLIKAIASTYSLDLQTLLAIPVALFYSRSLDGDFSRDRLDVLDSISKASDIVKIYCQKGRILVPNKFTNLFAFIEDAVAQIPPPSNISSFHPKVWVLRFEDDDHDAMYRVIVTSRNMTFDRSWDIAAYFDGHVRKRKQKNNVHLIDFVKILLKNEQFSGMREFMKDLEYAAFNHDPLFKNIHFHPIGIDNYKKYRNPLEERSFRKLLIVSPFLDESTLTRLQEIAEVRYLFSRKEELDKISKKTLKHYSAYYLSDLIVEGENLDSHDDGLGEPKRQQLHAKIFIGSNQNEHTWFIGSANCTSPAFSRNIEFMAELRGSRRNLSVDSIRKLFTGENGKYVIFEEYHREKDYKKEDISINNTVRQLEYVLINSDIRGEIHLNANKQNYDVLLRINCTDISWPSSLNVYINTLDDDKQKHVKNGMNNDIWFRNIKETALSKFIQLTIKHKKEIVRTFLLKIDIELPEHRKNKIIKSIIDSQEKFFQYIRFLLAESSIHEAPYVKASTKKGAKTNDYGIGENLPIFESLLVMASRNPEKLMSIDRMIERLKEESNNGEQLVPPEFEEFWEIFKPFARETK